MVNIEGGVKLSSTLLHLGWTQIPEAFFGIVTIFMKMWLLLSRVVITVTNLYISLVDIIMIIINAIITIDLHMWLVFNIIMSCFHHHHSLDGIHRQPVHVTCVLRPADLSVAVSVVVGKNLLMKEIELAKVSSEVGLVFVNC